MDNKKTEDKPLAHSVSEGLLIKGTIAGRSRRCVGDKNTELVSYKVFAGKNIYFVKEWAPKEYYHVGAFVELPITVKSFQKDGRVLIDFTICSFSASGEEF